MTYVISLRSLDAALRSDLLTSQHGCAADSSRGILNAVIYCESQVLRRARRDGHRSGC